MVWALFLFREVGHTIIGVVATLAVPTLGAVVVDREKQQHRATSSVTMGGN